MAVSPVSFQEGNMTMEELLSVDDFNVASIKTGDIVQGKVVAFDDVSEKEQEYVIVSIGSKSEGRIPASEFNKKPNVGDELEAIIKSIQNENGLIYLSQKELEMRRGWEVVSESYQTQLFVTGIVEKQMQRGYMVNVSGLPMFLPHSHVGNLGKPGERGRKPSLIGQTIICKILELDQRNKSGVISRKAFLEGQNAEKWKKISEKIKIGEIVTGKVIKHINIGLFVEVHDILGFLHKNNISWERHTGDFTKKIPVDSEIQLRVLEVDPDNHRLSLGLKQLTDDPWLSVANKFKTGDIVKGNVTYTANYGAFVDLGHGIEGLLHTSEMSWTRKINHAAEIVKKNQEIECTVLDVKPVEKRIALGFKQLHKNPWDEIKNTYKIGQTMKSKIRDITHFGLFVSITDEIDALIRKEDISWENNAPDLKKLYKVGDEVEFKITEINLTEKRIGCSIRHTLENPYKLLRQRYRRGALIDGIVSGVVDFGIFVKFEDIFEGLVHKSAMTKEEALNHQKTFQKGDKIQVVIKSIDTETRKISLSTKDVQTAVDRIEIESYIEKENTGILTSNPFKNLKSVVSGTN